MRARHVSSGLFSLAMPGAIRRKHPPRSHPGSALTVWSGKPSGRKGLVWIHLVAVHLVPFTTGQPVCMAAGSWVPSGFREWKSRASPFLGRAATLPWAQLEKGPSRCSRAGSTHSEPCGEEDRWGSLVPREG